MKISNDTPIVELPNGMNIFAKRREEALLMYGEVGNYLQRHEQEPFLKIQKFILNDKKDSK